MRSALILLAMLVLCAPSVLRAAPLATEELGGVPVLHEGRVKPLDTVARIALRYLSGDDSEAVAWLATMLFAPGDALEQPVVRVNSATLRDMLELPARTPPFYSYQELTPRLRAQKEALQQLAEKDANRFSATERALWTLYEQIDLMTQLSGTLSLLLPLDLPITPAIKQRFGIEAEPPYSYRDLSAHHQAIQQAVNELVAKHGDDVSTYNPEQQQLALLAFRLTTIESTGLDNQLLRIIPSSWSETGEWLSPWSVVLDGQGSPRSLALEALWHDLAMAYLRGDQAAWDGALSGMKSQLADRPDVSPAMLALERGINQLSLVPKAALLYMLATVLAALAIYRNSQPLRRAAVAVMLVALVAHLALIGGRMVLLGRPPVGTLYESVLFVALIAAAYGLWLSWKRGMAEGQLIGAALGAFLLAISGTYAGDGDTKSMLIAVLNTNFWLTTHVLCITIGYGCALVAGTLGHLALWRPQAIASNYLVGTTVVALLFTAVGTILGGVWADQSWGRFWGWDPKENGALLIVLWLVWLLHGRMTQHLGRDGFAALLGLTNIIVALSWFGVNLLNIGLHSYGFTQEAALGLAVFCASELALIGGLYGYRRHRLARGASV